MAVVGYGEYFARTIPGRVFAILICMVGVIIISLLVVALTNTFKLNNSEKKALNLINRLEARDRLISQAACLIIKSAKYGFWKNRLEKD